VQTLMDIRPDICLLGVNGINPKEGLTESDWEVMTIKRAMIKASKKIIALSIAEKLGSVQKIRVCELADIDVLITELDPLHEDLTAFREQGMEVI